MKNVEQQMSEQSVEGPEERGMGDHWLQPDRSGPGVKAKRATCPRCLRAQATCICHWIIPLEHEVEVLILQHPLEVNHAKGSAWLLHSSLARSELLVGETFPLDELQRRLAGKQNVLLYPETTAVAPVCSNSAPDTSEGDDPAAFRLIVLDGTWRKSRKMLFLNPLLQTLPRYPLHAPPSSQYLIRKAHRPDQLSTLEATCYALMQLERNEGRYLPLLRAFDGFVGQQLSYVS
jgi:DTW domain-containing protein YfiP